MDCLVSVHVAFSIISFVVGVKVLLSTKGDYTHKIFGWLFVLSILVCLLTSFYIRIYKNGQFSSIHALSALTLYFLLRGIYAVRYKPNNWQYIHAGSMGGAFISIIIAGTGVFVRKYVCVNNVEAGLAASALCAAICIYFLRKLVRQK